MTDTNRWWLQIAVFAVLLAASTWIWSARDQLSAYFAKPVTEEARGGGRGGGEGAIPVIAAEALQREDTLSIIAVGTARAEKSITIISEVAGQLTAMPVASGQTVKGGDVLATLDARAAQLALGVAKTRLDEAEQIESRAQQLRRKGVGSVAKVEDGVILVARAKLEVEQAQEILDDHTIRAPFGGVVGIPSLEIGDRVTTATELMSLDDRSALVVEFELPERFISRIAVDQAVKATTPSYGDRVFDGQISRIDSRIDAASRTVRVRGAFDNVDDVLRPGMSFEMSLTIPGKDYVAVPELAVQWSGENTFVWRIRDFVVEKVDVSLIRRANGLILVDGKLVAGDLIVVEGVQRLRDGRKVRYGTQGGPGDDSKTQRKGPEKVSDSRRRERS